MWSLSITTYNIILSLISIMIFYIAELLLCFVKRMLFAILLPIFRFFGYDEKNPDFFFEYERDYVFTKPPGVVYGTPINFDTAEAEHEVINGEMCDCCKDDDN